MTTNTSEFGLAKPVVGVTRDTWGNNGWSSPNDTAVGWNDNAMIIDYHMFSRKDGGTIEGPITVQGSITAEGSFTCSGGDATINRSGDGDDAKVIFNADSSYNQGVYVTKSNSTTEPLVGMSKDNDTPIIGGSFGTVVYAAIDNHRYAVDGDEVAVFDDNGGAGPGNGRLTLKGTGQASNPPLYFDAHSTGAIYMNNGADAMNFAVSGTNAARIDPDVDEAEHPRTLMTRRKSDARYAQTSAFAVLLNTMVSKGTITTAERTAILAAADGDD